MMIRPHSVFPVIVGRGIGRQVCRVCICWRFGGGSVRDDGFRRLLLFIGDMVSRLRGGVEVEVVLVLANGDIALRLEALDGPTIGAVRNAKLFLNVSRAEIELIVVLVAAEVEIQTEVAFVQVLISCHPIGLADL